MKENNDPHADPSLSLINHDWRPKHHNLTSQLNSAKDPSPSSGPLHYSMHGLWGDSWVGLKLSGQDLRTWLLYHHQAIACCGTDCSSICFVWLIATLKVITSGTKRPCELQKPLPIARLWLFNISVRANEIFRVGCWALYQEHTRDYIIREVYTAMTTERHNEI